MTRCLAGLILCLGTLARPGNAALLHEYETNGIALTAGFIPDATEIALGEPLFVTFLVSNRGTQPFLFSHVRNEIFRIAATNDTGQPVQSRYFGMDGNGPLRQASVAPGKALALRVFLNERCRFDQPGAYAVHCQADLRDYSAGRQNLGQPVVTQFALRVRPADHDQAGRLIARWGRSLLTNGSPEEAVLALAEFNDARTIPHLAVLVTNRSHIGHRAVEALARYTNEPAAADALMAALRTGEDFVAGAAGKALRASGQADRAARAFLGALTHAEANTRIQAAWAIGWTGAELALDPLCGLLRDPSNSVRYAAAQAIGRLNAPGSFGALTNCLADADFALRVAAVRGLVHSGRPVDPSWVKPMILGGGENIRTYYESIDLLRLHGGALAAPGLASCLHFDDPSVRHAYNFRLVLALEFSPNGPKHYYKWRHDPNRDGTEEELAENRRILSEIKAWLAAQAAK